MLNAIMRYPEKIPCDKRIHFMIGTVFTSVLLSFGVMCFLIILLLIAFAWSIEIYQKLTKSGQYDNYDALAVVAGGLIVLLPKFIEIL